jgi:prepilin-type processing-associated H-X9-DG protein
MIQYHHLSRTIRPPANALGRPANGFALREIIVIIVIIGVIAAIGIPIYSAKKLKANQAVALEKIRTLGGAIATYVSQNNDALPQEDADGNDTWNNAAKPAAKDAWYNALPRLAGKKGVGDYVNSPEAFYTDENILFLPGANYPDKKKLINPLFAIAYNTKLQRTNPDGSKSKTMMKDITKQERTVALLEQGLVNESRTLEVQTKNDYDGSPKGSAKSFVGRYGGKGHLYFLDGHAELVEAKDVLQEDGKFPFPQNNIVWTRTPEENPNKESKEKKK